MEREIFRIACLGIIILGWIWNRKQWGFRGPKKLVDGEGIIFVGFVVLIMLQLIFDISKWWVTVLLITCIVIGQEFRDKSYPKDHLLGIWIVLYGTLALTFPGFPLFTLMTIVTTLIILFDRFILEESSKRSAKKIIQKYRKNYHG